MSENKASDTENIKDFESDRISFSADINSGFVTAVRNPDDPHGMNWVLDNSDWGYIDGFETESVKSENTTVTVTALNRREKLRAETVRYIEAGRFVEKYIITNLSQTEFFITADNFGIHFPFNCDFTKRKNVLETSCITHIWCGGDFAYMYSAKPGGDSEYLVSYASSGSFSNYSIAYDGSRVSCAAWYRGCIVIHPTDCIIEPGEKKEFSFVHEFMRKTPDKKLVDLPFAVHVSADKYTAFVNEKIHCRFEAAFDIKDFEVMTENSVVECVKSKNRAEWDCSFSETGEKTVYIKYNGKSTLIRINIIEKIEEILRKRAKFICEKQQYIKPQSPLCGAYLIYDRATGRQYFNAAFKDNNSGRERLSMGVIVAKQLQASFDPGLMSSLELHRGYVERELFDIHTAEVFDGPGRDGVVRAYNYPWMAVYYLEWYNLTGEKNCIRYAADILLRYYRLVEKSRQESPCMETLEIYRALGDAGETERQSKLKEAFIRHTDNIKRELTSFYSEEVSCTQCQFLMKVISLCYAYDMTGNREYLDPIPSLVKMVRAFCAFQPDFHVNSLAVRYWDMFWFGKMKAYGDSMPQWLCALSGQMYALLSDCFADREYAREADRILRNNLCVYFDDGFSASGYLVPYKVVQFFSGEKRLDMPMPYSTVFGKRYDDWANDQDWALYYAYKYRNTVN